MQTAVGEVGKGICSKLPAFNYTRTKDIDMASAEKLKISVEEYLQGELASDIKHEYIEGEVYAMSGAQRAHNVISMNLAGMFFAHLHGSPFPA